MLECYLDDGGTHDGSRVIVWGGVAGDKRFFDELEVAWKAQLGNPCKGKSPIKAFHSSHLAMGVGEFEGYNQAERDLTRRNFRKIITDLGLTVISYGISIDGWDKVARDNPLGKYFTAESYVFGHIVNYVCQSAKEHRDPVSFQFDQGRFSSELVSSVKGAFSAAEVDEDYVNYTFSPVKLNMGLQAADLVAHETYRYFCKFLESPSAEPDAHLKRLIEGVYDSSAGWFGENEVRAILGRIDSDTKLQNHFRNDSFRK